MCPEPSLSCGHASVLSPELNRWTAGIPEGLELGCFSRENRLLLVTGSLLFGNFCLKIQLKQAPLQPWSVLPGLFHQSTECQC